MKYEKIFSVGFDRSYGGCDYSVSATKITRKEFEELVAMTFYALKQLELNIEIYDGEIVKCGCLGEEQQ